MSQFWLTGVSKIYLRADYLLMLKKKIAHLQRCTWPISQSSTGSIPTLIKEKTRCFSDHSLCSELYLQIERITTVVFNLPTFSWKFAIYLQLQQLFWFCCRDYAIKGESYSSTSHSLVHRLTSHFWITGIGIQEPLMSWYTMFTQQSIEIFKISRNRVLEYWRPQLYKTV